MIVRVHLTRLLAYKRRCIAPLVAIVVLVIVALVAVLDESAFEEGLFQDWKPVSYRSTLEKSKQRYFKEVAGQETFLYSAIANDREPVPGELNIIITAFDATKTKSFRCCVLFANDKLYTTTTTTYFDYYIENILGPVLELFKNAPTKAKQYACVVPEIGFEATHVMLTSSVCPDAVEDYLPVIRPKKVPNGFALCAKVAYGDDLDPTKLMEWFEVQRLMGVDNIQLMDLHNPVAIQKVFRYYQDIGLLDLLPYELPGPPYSRGLDKSHWVHQQASHDETFPILDCRQRLAGYSYIMGVDMDEILMPARHNNLKHFIKEQLQTHPDAAGFFFWTEFFVYDWGPVNNKSDITFFRYLNSTMPRWECRKYIYLPSRVSQARTHDFTAKSSYKQYYVPKEEAILHHYRKCPHVWSDCNPPQITDNSILRFQKELEERMKEARIKIGISPPKK